MCLYGRIRGLDGTVRVFPVFVRALYCIDKMKYILYGTRTRMGRARSCTVRFLPVFRDTAVPVRVWAVAVSLRAWKRRRSCTVPVRFLPVLQDKRYAYWQFRFIVGLQYEYGIDGTSKRC